MRRRGILGRVLDNILAHIRLITEFAHQKVLENFEFDHFTV
jgi:hypothetical protein